MVDIALGILGLWLVVAVFHHELRRREYQLARAAHQGRLEVAQERVQAISAELEEHDASPSGTELPTPPLEVLSEPTPSQIAAMVAPSPPEPKGGDAELLEQVQAVVRKNPELATTSIRRLIASDGEPISSTAPSAS